MPYTKAQARAIFAKNISKHGRKRGEKLAAKIVGEGGVTDGKGKSYKRNAPAYKAEAKRRVKKKGRRRY